MTTPLFIVFGAMGTTRPASNNEQGTKQRPADNSQQPTINNRQPATNEPQTTANTTTSATTSISLRGLPFQVTDRQLSNPYLDRLTESCAKVALKCILPKLNHFNRATLLTQRRHFSNKKQNVRMPSPAIQ